MFTTLLAYFIVILIVPIIGSISGFVVAPLFFLQKLIGKSVPLFIYGSIGNFVSVWAGVKILNLFGEEPGIILMLIILAVSFYHYFKDDLQISSQDSFVSELVKEHDNQNLVILLGNIVGIIIGWSMFIG
jgi:hypothetical protein